MLIATSEVTVASMKLNEKEIKIYIPRQVRCEYLRNRDSKIKDALDKFKITDVQFPNLVKCYDEYNELKKKFDE